MPEQEVERADFVGILTTDLGARRAVLRGGSRPVRDPNHTEGRPDFHTGNVSAVLTDVAKTGDEFRQNGAIALRVPTSLRRWSGCSRRA